GGGRRIPRPAGQGLHEGLYGRPARRRREACPRLGQRPLVAGWPRGTGMGIETRQPGTQAPPAPRSEGPLRFWNRGVDGLAALGTVMIVILMTIIVADVLFRNIAGASLPLVA